ncbi:MAG: hypothetical protein F4X09_13540 [Gammaproteobacteria bacterium]|nr:hypothetical protein [Gammaproteobacteria bacterium]
MSVHGILLAGAAMTCALAAFPAQAQLPLESDYFLEAPDSVKHAVIVVGPSVGEENISQFRQWGYSLHDILVRDYGYSTDTITLLHDPDEAGPNPGNRLDGTSDRAGIEEAFAALLSRISDGDQVTVYLIGHGSGEGEEAKFNIIGPDMTGAEFREILDRFERQDMVVINTTSASYGFSTFLSSEGRVVISATRSPSEKFDPVFSRYFIEALDGRAGDLDKNNRVSMLEAFNYAKANVEQWYEEQGRLASEHAGLDDNGDSQFSLGPGMDDPDGRLAEIAYIDAAAAETENLSGEALELKTRMQQLERSVFILRGRKNDYLEQDYWRRMEELLVDLARTTARLIELNPELNP